jgi:polysaccharide biosynthesis transport protein
MLQRPSTMATLPEAEEEKSFDLRGVLNFLWRQWKFIASVLGVSMLVAVVWLAREVPRYTATTLVLLDPRKEKVAGTDSLISDIGLDLPIIESQMSIVKSTVFMRRVVERERLVSDPEFGTGSPQTASMLDTVRTAITGESRGPPSAKEIQAIPPQLMNSIEALKGATSISRVGQGYVLAVSVTSLDPARAARLANAVADAYVLDKLDARLEAAQRASGWLSDRLADLRKQLRESEEAVGQFRSEHGLVQAGGSITLNQQQLADLNSKRVQARAETAEKKARYDFIKMMESKGVNIQNLPDSINSAALVSLRQQDRTIAQKESDLASRYTNNHPLMVNVRAERADVQRAIAAEMQRMVANVQNDYELAKAREDALDRTFKEATGQTTLDDKAAITLRELERTAAVNKSLFEDFLQRAKITEGQSSFEAREARVITPALPPGGPSYPQKNRTLSMAFIIGLLLGVGGAVAKEMLNSGFTTPRQVEDLLQVPVLTSVRRMENRDLAVDGKPIPIHLYPAVKPLSRFNESLRVLRTGIQMTDVDNPPRVIQITSAVPNEGKTTIALSLAVSAAVAGHKVLFIDADLRHPSASGLLNLENERGLVDLLVGDVSPQQVIRFHEDGKCWVLPAGSKTQNPADLLGSERMKALVASFSESFDYVLIDSPPLGPVIDSVIVSQLVDKAVVVIRWAATPRELVQNAVQQIPGHKKIAGIAFNQLNEGQAQKYGKYAHSQYYSSNYYKKYYTD